MSNEVLDGQQQAGLISVKRTGDPSRVRHSDAVNDGGVLYSDRAAGQNVIDPRATSRGLKSLYQRVQGVVKHDGACSCITFEEDAAGKLVQRGMATRERFSRDPHCARCGGLIP